MATSLTHLLHEWLHSNIVVSTIHLVGLAQLFSTGHENLTHAHLFITVTISSLIQQSGKFLGDHQYLIMKFEDNINSRGKILPNAKIYEKGKYEITKQMK